MVSGFCISSYCPIAWEGWANWGAQLVIGDTLLDVEICVDAAGRDLNESDRAGITRFFLLSIAKIFILNNLLEEDRP
jgi:hypothetical protein